MSNEPTKQQIKKWCNALRGGRYAQTHGVLNDMHGYCCLGVACDIFIPESKKNRSRDYIWGGLPNSQPHAPDWLKNINGNFLMKSKVDGKSVSLTTLNDSDYSFDEIADCLELVYIHKVLE